MNRSTSFALLNALTDSISKVREVGIPILGSEFSENSYRMEFANALGHMKKATVRVAESGEMAGIELIAGIPDMLKELASTERSPEANEIFWDQLSTTYAIRSDWFYRKTPLSDKLELRILAQMTAQDSAPEKMARTQLESLPDHLFMQGLTTVLQEITPPARQLRFEAFSILTILNGAVIRKGIAKEAAEHIAAHQNLYFPFFLAILDEYRAKCECPQGASPLMSRIAQAISLTPELLAHLYELTGHPMIKEIGEITIENPYGRTPFTFLEQIGVVRTPEWHVESQEKSGIGAGIALFEHAIMTPGIEMSVKRVTNQPLKSGKPGIIQGLIALMERVPVDDPECRRKAQILFDALVANAASGKSDPTLKELLLTAKIPKTFYRNHPGLKSERLENELGL